MDDVVASHAAAVRLVRAAEQIKRDFARAIAPSGLSVPAARTLLLIDAPMPMREVSERLACDKSYITRIADELEERGLVRRVSGDDRRVQLLELTPAGTRLRRSLFDAFAATNPVARRLGPADRRALDRTLDLLPPD